MIYRRIGSYTNGKRCPVKLIAKMCVKFNQGLILLSLQRKINVITSCFTSLLNVYTKKKITMFYSIYSYSSLKPLPLSSVEEVRCRCITIPSSQNGVVYGLSVNAINHIDFNTVFSNFDISNFAVYGTIIIILLVYVILVVILRRKDFQDLNKVFIIIHWFTFMLRCI